MIVLSKRILMSAIALLIFCDNAFCEPRILIVGDSWAGLTWDHHSFHTALEQAGLIGYDVLGMDTGIGGSTAEEWATDPAKKALITLELEHNPTIDTVLLFLGGNDVLFALLQNISINYVRENIPDVVKNIGTVADFILSHRPDIRILLIEYDYLPLEGIGALLAPTFNDILIEAAKQRFQLSQQIDRLHYLSNLGLMQHTYGIPGRAQPGTTPLPGGPPDHSPLIGGDPDRPSPSSSFDDPIHLTKAGYDILAKRVVDYYLRDWLLHPLQASNVDDWQLYQ